MHKFRYLWSALLALALVLWLVGYRGEKSFIIGAAAALLLVATEILLRAHAMDVELAKQYRGDIAEARFGKNTIVVLSVVGSMIGVLGVLALVVAILFVTIF